MAHEKKQLLASSGGENGNESSAVYTPATQHFQVGGRACRRTPARLPSINLLVYLALSSWLIRNTHVSNHQQVNPGHQKRCAADHSRRLGYEWADVLCLLCYETHSIRLGVLMCKALHSGAFWPPFVACLHQNRGHNRFSVQVLCSPSGASLIKQPTNAGQLFKEPASVEAKGIQTCTSRKEIPFSILC